MCVYICTQKYVPVHVHDNTILSNSIVEIVVVGHIITEETHFPYWSADSSPRYSASDPALLQCT